MSTPTARMTAIGRVAELLVGLVGERHLRRDRDRVAGVHAHRVEVLDRADDHDVVGAVADDLELELVPAAHRLLDEHLADRARREAELDLALRAPSGVETNPPPWPPSVNAGRIDRRQRRRRRARSSDVTIARRRHAQAARLDGVLEELAVLGARDRVDVRADQLDAELLEHARLVQLAREVERGLAAHRRQQRVGPLAPQHVGDAFEVERLEVRAVGEAGVGHDRRRVRVDDDRAVAVVAQHLQRLAAGVVELAGLPDHDRARSRSGRSSGCRHAAARRTSSTHSPRIDQASCGPGPASGWNCTERARSSG